LMQKGLDQIIKLKRRYQNIMVEDKGRAYNLDLVRVLELGCMLDLAHLIALGAIARKESRGAHYREDYQKMDNQNFLKHSMVNIDENGNSQLSYKPVVIEDIEPLAEIKY
jgi:succinate dehydrogenase / fumarate reductase flavoprotein subunit